MPHMLEKFVSPPPFRLTTGGEAALKIIAERDEFFHTVRTELLLAEDKFDPYFDIESYQLNVDDSQPTDNRIHLLGFKGIQTIAEVLDKRDDMNFHVITFAAHSLSLHVMRAVLDIQSAAGKRL